MLVELFYPKELKETILDLKVKNDLNEEALMITKLFLFKSLAVIIFCSVVLAVVGHWSFGFMLLIFACLFVRFDFAKYFEHKIAPYTFGTLELLQIEKRKSYRYGIKLLLANDHLTPLLPGLWKEGRYQKGDSIYCFVLGNRCMPDIKDLKNKYCLSISALQKGE